MIRVLPTGKVEVVTGTAPHGQGHETSWAMIVADRLGIPVDDVEVLHSDTAISHLGPRHLRLALARGRGQRDLLGVREGHRQGRRAIAAHQMEAAEEDLEFVAGEFRVKGTPASAMPIQAIAFAAFTAHNLPDGVEPNLTAEASYDPIELHVPVRRAHRRRRRRRGDRQRRPRAVRRGRRLRQPGQPADRRRPGARRDRPGCRAGAVGGGRVRRGRPAPHRRRWSTTSCRPRPRCRASSSVTPSRRARRTRWA